MAEQDLEKRFRYCWNYRFAPSWLKPALNPSRFVGNQVRHRLRRPALGALQRADAFHVDNFVIVAGECVSEEIASYGIYEPELTAAFLQLVHPGQVVADVGMHLGYFSTLFACLVGASGQVHSFEPTPSTRKLAQENVGRFDHIRVYPFALWSSAQTMTFQDFGPQWMAFNSLSQSRLPDHVPPASHYEVQTTTLDQFRKNLGQPVALVKIDAESAELEILRGAEKLLAEDHPFFTLEVGDTGKGASTSRDLISWFSERLYAPWEVREGRLRRHTPRPSYQYDNLIFAPAHLDLAHL
jgi:FkbM family methyltransferase